MRVEWSTVSAVAGALRAVDIPLAGARRPVQPFAPPGFHPPRDGPSPEAASHADSGGTRSEPSDGRGLWLTPDGQVYVLCPLIKSASLALATPTDPARSPLTAVAGRRPDALPVLSGEIDYAGGLSAEDWRDQLFYKSLIWLEFALKRTGIQHGLSPYLPSFPPLWREPLVPPQVREGQSARALCLRFTCQLNQGFPPQGRE
jgi:hypothetical protein